MKDFVRYQLPAILWALLIFIVSSIPTLPTLPVEFRPIDKLAHLAEYFIFGFLLALAFANRVDKKRLTLRLTIAVAVGMTYAASDELHQSLVPGRYASVDDFVADALGVITAQIVFYYRSRLLGWLRYPKMEYSEKPDSKGS